MLKNHRGFSLVELLVVTVIMGLVVGAVYTLYLSTQKTAITSEEVVDVQQNLRFSLDQMAKDIRMAGLLEMNNRDPFGGELDRLSEGDFIINTGPRNTRYALVIPDTSPNYNVNGGEAELTVSSADTVDLFEAGTSGDDVVVIRTEPDKESSLASPPLRTFRVFTGKVKAKNRNAPSLTLENLTIVPSQTYEPDIIKSGDLIYHSFNITDSTVYSLVSDPEGTNVNRLDRNGEPLANKINDVEFEYIHNSDGQIVAVRVRIIGQTDETMTGRAGFSGIKTRELETVSRLRNR